jgi:glutathione S-transferase
MLGELEVRLSRHANLCREQRALADIAIMPFVRQFAGVDTMWFEAQPVPHVIAWLARHVASALFEQMFRRLKPWAPDDAVTIWPA